MEIGERFLQVGSRILELDFGRTVLLGVVGVGKQVHRGQREPFERSRSACGQFRARRPLGLGRLFLRCRCVGVSLFAELACERRRRALDGLDSASRHRGRLSLSPIGSAGLLFLELGEAGCLSLCAAEGLGFRGGRRSLRDGLGGCQGMCGDDPRLGIAVDLGSFVICRIDSL